MIYCGRDGGSAAFRLARPGGALWSPPRVTPEFDIAPTPLKIANLIAAEIKATSAQVSAAVELLDEGATVPFIARYRKVTGGLDDTQLRVLSERLTYLRELEARRASILESISRQGKLTDELAGKIAAVMTSRTRRHLSALQAEAPHQAKIARERGLGPLAEQILADRALVPAALAEDSFPPTWLTSRRRSKAHATSSPSS